MSGRSRLPSGEPRKASQKRSRRGEAPQVVPIEIPWQPGERVRQDVPLQMDPATPPGTWEVHLS